MAFTVIESVAMTSLHAPITGWYDAHARDLPWRRPGVTPWAVMVSEFMLQQTPVTRVLGVWEAWMDRWPTPADLAAAPSGEAVRAWGRLGYPRRALRLHAAAVAITEQYGAQVPASYHDLIELPGVGDYTASAIASWCFNARHVVLDTNIRRVFARAVSGVEFPATSVTRAERDLAAVLLAEVPGAGTDDDEAAHWNIAVMELGALVCTATNPACTDCPILDQCAWVAAGRPAHDGPPRRGQAWAGTDRQVRGRLMAVLRETDGPVHISRLDIVWSDAVQRDRALAGLLDDGLMVQVGPASYALPS